MAAAIARFLKDETYTAECVRRGLARAKEFRWDRTAERVYAAYGQAIERRRQRSRAA
jgi:glycosyltransferase involved in cell wall biosynthesis